MAEVGEMETTLGIPGVSSGAIEKRPPELLWNT